VQSLVKQDEICVGVDRLHKEIDMCMEVYNVCSFPMTYCSPYCVYQLRVGRQRGQAQIEWALIVQSEYFELRQVIQRLLGAFGQYTRDPNTLPALLADPTFHMVVQDIEEVRLQRRTGSFAISTLLGRKFVRLNPLPPYTVPLLWCVHCP